MELGLNCLKTCVRSLYAINHIKNVHPTATGLRFKSVKSAVLHELNTDLKIEDMKTPKKLKKEEVRIKVHYCSINQSDILMCKGEYDNAIKPPFIPGHELSGEVLEVGEQASKDGFRVGTHVLGLSKDNFGGLSEEAVLSSLDVWELPESIKMKKGAVLGDTYSTALLGLARRGRISDKHTVLVTAAAGGLGLAAVDIAANVYRSKVIAICETEHQASLLREKGAWAALVYQPKDVLKKVKEVTGGKGVHLVFDAVGGKIFENVSKCVGPEGTVILAGFASRTIQQVDTGTLLPNSFNLIGISLSNYRLSSPEVYRGAVQDVIDMCEQGLLSPDISKVFSLADVNSAFEFMKKDHTTGNVVVKLGED